MSRTTKRVLTAVGLAVMIVAGVTAASRGGAAQAQTPGATPPFLQADHCYRIAFTIDGAPNYKVLALLDGGWIKAEVDAGPASAQRQPFWINTAQIVTIREARCSQ
jgi:hypothetical protein